MEDGIIGKILGLCRQCAGIDGDLRGETVILTKNEEVLLSRAIGVDELGDGDSQKNNSNSLGNRAQEGVGGMPGCWNSYLGQPCSAPWWTVR